VNVVIIPVYVCVFSQEVLSSTLLSVIFFVSDIDNFSSFIFQYNVNELI